MVPRILWDFYLSLKDAGLEKHRLFPVFHPKLSLLIDPNRIEDSSKQIVFDQSVDLLIVEAPPKGIPRLAFDVYSAEQQEAREDKAAVFNSIGVPYSAINIDSPPQIDRQWLDSVMTDTPDLERLRDVILDWQWNAMLELDRIAGSKGLFLLHEVALESVISISNEGLRAEGQDNRDGTESKAIPWHHVRFLRQTSFDGLICTPPPNCRPIMAIEYDGSHHLGSKQRDKDQKKNEACESANLPLLRIQSRDLPLENEASRQNVVSEQRRLTVKHMLELLVSELTERQLASDWYLEQIHHFMMTTAKSIQAEFPHISEDVSDYGREILEIARQRSVELEEAKQDIQGVHESWSRANENSYEFQMRSDEEKWERTQPHNPHLLNIAEALENDFESAVLLNDSDFSAVDIDIGGGSGAGPRYLEVKGSEILKLGGLNLTRRKFVETNTNISVIADRFALEEPIRQRAVFGVLRAQAIASLAADKERILAAYHNGAEAWSLRAEARSLLKRLRNREKSSSEQLGIEKIVDQKIIRAGARKSADLRREFSHLAQKLNPEQLEKLAPRNYEPREIVQKLKTCHDRLKVFIGFLDVDSNMKMALRKYATLQIDRALTQVGSQDGSVQEK